MANFYQQILQLLGCYIRVFPVLKARMFLGILYLGCLNFVDYQVIHEIHSTPVIQIYLCLKICSKKFSIAINCKRSLPQFFYTFHLILFSNVFSPLCYFKQNEGDGVSFKYTFHLLVTMYWCQKHYTMMGLNLTPPRGQLNITCNISIELWTYFQRFIWCDNTEKSLFWDQSTVSPQGR